MGRQGEQKGDEGCEGGRKRAGTRKQLECSWTGLDEGQQAGTCNPMH